MPTTPLPVPPWGPVGDVLLNVGTGVFLTAAVIELAFLLHYVTVAPAFKSWVGWMFVLRSITFLLAGVAILLGRVLGSNYAGRPVVTLALFSVVLASSAVTYGTFLYERHRGATNPTHPLGLFARLQRVFRASRAPEPDTEPSRSTGPLQIVGDAP